MGANVGEINCMILRLALYLARTTPNENIDIPEQNKRVPQSPRAIANQSAATVPISFSTAVPFVAKIIPIRSCNPFPSSLRRLA